MLKAFKHRHPLCVFLAGLSVFAVFGFFLLQIGIATVAHLSGKETIQFGHMRFAISPQSACYTYDVEDPNERAGNCGYIFLGIVNCFDGTIYTDSSDPDGHPESQYTVSVLENIKGELQTDQPITVGKYGGIARDHLRAVVLEDDFYPAVGSVCLFSASGTEDGGLYCFGPSSVIPVDEINAATDREVKSAVQKLKPKGKKILASHAAEIKTLASVADRSEIVKTYRDAIQNPASFLARPRYVSQYDVSDTEHEVGEAYYVTPQPS